MNIKRQFSGYIFDIFNYLSLFFLTFLTLYPFIHVLMGSFSDPGKLFGYDGFMIVPRGFSFEGYVRVFQNEMIMRSFLNSVIYVVSGTGLCIVLTPMGGYVLSRKDFYWKPFLTVMLVIPMYFGGGLIAFYLWMNKLGMVNTIWALIIPGCIGTYNMILVRTNIKNIPIEMEESAKIDGASQLVTLFIIIFPLILPIIAVITLFQAVGLWNDWFNPSIFLHDRKMFPLQSILREILIEDQTQNMVPGLIPKFKKENIDVVRYATIIISILPVICFYPFLQKYFVKGIMVGAIKG